MINAAEQRVLKARKAQEDAEAEARTARQQCQQAKAGAEARAKEAAEHCEKAEQEAAA